VRPPESHRHDDALPPGARATPVPTSATQAPRLHIGILTYNGLAHTMRFLDSLAAHTQAPWRALVLDNASCDDTPAFLRALTDPRITAHRGERNLGVSGGRNWLLAQLLPTLRDDDLIVLLDNDIEVSAGWEAPFLEAFTTRPELGVAGRWAFSMRVHDSWRDILAEHSAESGPADTVQGCCFWIRASAARAVGEFDTTLGGFWHEDDDYCIRALTAGWDVRRVSTDAIVHHEHGSGVALRPDKVAGSLRNQRYLADKWRRMDAIDAMGVPRRPGGDDGAVTRAELAQRIGRPLLRTEVNSALVAATLLLHAELPDARVGPLASPLTRLLLDDAATLGGDTATRAQRARARVGHTIAQRRATAPALAATSRAFSGVCTPDAWDDPRWADTYTAWLRDGSGVDFHARHEMAWRDGQLLLALRTLGVLRRDACVLVVGHPVERIIGALTHHAADVTIADRDPCALSDVQGYATQEFGGAILATASWPLRSGTGGAYDVVVCPNLSRYAPADESTAMLAMLSRCARIGGVVAVALSVRIAGPENGRWLELSTLANDEHLQRASLQRVGGFSGAISDELLLNAVPAESAQRMRPGLSRYVAPHCVSLATLVARRT